MRTALGDRSMHTVWYGGVLDSVIGVFLTQVCVSLSVCVRVCMCVCALVCLGVSIPRDS
jgi:hypothetical protein